MLNRLIENLLHFFVRFRLLVLALVVLAVGGASAYVYRYLAIEEDIYALLPEQTQVAKFSEFAAQTGITDQVVFAVSISPDEIGEAVRSLGDSLVVLLERKFTGSFTRIEFRQEQEEIELWKNFWSLFPLYADTSDYVAIQEKLTPEQIKLSLSNGMQRLQMPMSGIYRDIFVRDPLGLTSGKLEDLKQAFVQDNRTVEDGVMLDADRKSFFVRAVLSPDVMLNQRGLEVRDRLDALQREWAGAYPQNPFTYFGGFLVAVANAEQVKQDTATSLTIALSIIFFILMGYYRRAYVVLFFAPVLFAVPMALSIVTLWKGSISGLAIGSGAVVLGIIMDFAFHYFTHYKHSKASIETSKEVAAPMLLGCLTTAMAFGALHFTSSPILQEFGVFAALCLVFACLFTLFVMPVVLSIFPVKERKNKTTKAARKPMKGKVRWGLGLVMVAATIVLAFFAGDVKFEEDLYALNFYPDELKERELALQDLDTDRYKRVFIFVEGETQQEVLSRNEEVYDRLEKHRSQESIKNVLSVSALLPSVETQKRRTALWESFWLDRSREGFVPELNQQAQELGLNPKALLPFINWTASGETGPLDMQTLPFRGLDNLLHQQEDGWLAVNSFLVRIEERVELAQAFSSLEGVHFWDKGLMAQDLVAGVQADFNLILYLTSGLVFLTLLLTYGRIELTLITALPMLISWIWILGLAAIFGFSFNVVNIILATFIFGLGDDFCIFITDGLQGKYTEGKAKMGPYRHAIMLSAATTIAGTGALIFAKHPALHSIGGICVLGLLCILLSSLVLQPLLYDVFIGNRIKNKRTPLTFFGVLLSVFAFTFFLFGCLLTFVLQFAVRLLPLPKAKKRYAVNVMLSLCCKALVYVMGNVKKKVEGRENLDFSKPSVVIANHSSFLDILLLVMLHPRLLLVTNDWVYRSPVFGVSVRYAGYFLASKGIEHNLEDIRARVEEGYSVAIFPEGTRSVDGKLKRFHKGAFYLAEQLQLPITPVMIHGAGFTMPKGDFLLKHGILSLKVLPRIAWDDATYGAGYKERTKRIAAEFKKQYQDYVQERETGSFMQKQLLANYTLKGPVLEWYFRVKWKLEYENYALYHRLIGERKTILDLGCGYGFLSYYLGLKDRTRTITGVDYDEDKINVAQHSVLKTDLLDFQAGDIQTYNYNAVDVICLADVLHYLEKDAQVKVLERAVERLNQDGIILIRDGVTDLSERHKVTKLSEFFSTNFGFNQKSSDFYFFNRNFVEQFCSKHNLSLEVVDQTKKTSNLLFIIKKHHG